MEKKKEYQKYLKTHEIERSNITLSKREKYNRSSSTICLLCTNIIISILPIFSFIDMDECTTRPGLCRNGTCVNLIGSYRCDCHTGFALTERGICQGN